MAALTESLALRSCTRGPAVRIPEPGSAAEASDEPGAVPGHLCLAAVWAGLSGMPLACRIL